MTTATQTAERPMARPRSVNAESANKPRRNPARLPAQAGLRGLFAEWRKLSPNLDIEPREGETAKDAERRARIEWTVRQFTIHNSQFTILSWSQLTPGQAKFLLKAMRRATGNSPLNDYIPEAAIELWGGDWDAFLAARLDERFGAHRISQLEPLEKAAAFEEFCSRLARTRGCEIEEVKREIMGKVRRRPRPEGIHKSGKAES